MNEIHRNSRRVDLRIANSGRTIAIVALACFLACAAQKETRDTSGQQQQRNTIHGPVADRTTHIAPGRCRIVGTLVGVDSSLAENGPCAKAPCHGTVRVDSIVGYGAAFGNPIAVNERIRVTFAFTLAPTTKDLFPTMSDRLPGLQVGERFWTDLESQPETGIDEQRTVYRVYRYEKLN